MQNYVFFCLFDFSVHHKAHPSVQRTGHSLKKQMNKDKIGRNLSKRPSIDDLRNRNIYRGSPTKFLTILIETSHQTITSNPTNRSASLFGKRDNLERELVKNNMNYFLEV